MYASPGAGSYRARVRIIGSGRAGLACSMLLARAAYDVEVVASAAGDYDAFEAFDASFGPTMRALGIADPQAACRARAVAGFNGEHYLVARRAHVRDVLLRSAREAGATLLREPPEAGDAYDWLVDASGRTGRYTAVARDEAMVAYLFDAPPTAALAMVQLGNAWCYRIGDERGSTLGVVAPAGTVDDAVARRVAHAAFGNDVRGVPLRRSATRQRAAEPIAGRRIAVGDAALAHEPSAGQGQRFALTTALLAAATIRTCTERPALAAMARRFYADAIARSGRTGARHADPPAVDLARRHAFAGALARGPVLRDGFVDEEDVVTWPAGSTRWIAGVDLAAHADAFTETGPGWHVVGRLARRGVDTDRAVAVVTNAIRIGLLVPA